MENTFHPLDYFAAVRRRRWWLVVPIVLSVAAGALLLQILPKQYRAEATLGVAAAAISPTIVNQTIVLDVQERLRAITHQLLSDTVLRRVVTEEGLASGDAVQGAINRVRASVQTSVPDPISRSVEEARRIDAFRVAYTDSDPTRAQRVTNRLAAVFIEETSTARATTAERSAEFLIDERDRAAERLGQLEEKLRRAKEAYIGRLPEQTQANLSTLASLRQQFEANANTLRFQQEKLSLVQRQLDAMEQDAARGVVLNAGGSLVPDRVTTLERELAAARAMYTSKHPEVQRLETELQNALQEAVAPPERPAVDRKARLQVDPTYRQLQADRQATLLSIKELEHASATMRAQIADYQQRVEAAPMVEQQLAAVQREYDLAQKHYADLAARATTATMAQDVARNREGEQFALIYPASLPSEPSSPVPSRVMLFALFIGICLGGALALGREYLDTSVYSTRDLADELDVPVLGEVAHIPASR